MRLVVSTLALLIVASGLSGQTDPNATGRNQPLDHTRVAALIDQLGNTDWATRQRAERLLLITSRDELPFIEARLGDASLSPEQRVRLWRVGSRIFRRLPHAAMGISFVSGQRSDPPQIRTPLPEFDASRVIRPGDLVTQLNDRPVYTVADLRAAIISCEPDEQVTVEIMRSEQLLTVSLRLGAYSKLQNQRLNEADLDAAWQWRINWSGVQAGNEMAHEDSSPISVPLVPTESPAVQAVSTTIAPTIYQLGAAVAVAAGQPLASPASSRYNPGASDSEASRRQGTADGRAVRRGRVQDRNRDKIAQFTDQIAKNRRTISLLNQRIIAIDSNLKLPHKESERKRLTEMRERVALEVMRLTIKTTELNRFLDALRR